MAADRSAHLTDAAGATRPGGHWRAHLEVIMASPEYEKLSAVLKPGLAVASDPPDLVREKMTAVHPTGGTPASKVE